MLAEGTKSHPVLRTGADGLDFPRIGGCELFHIIARDSIQEMIGRVTPARRRAISRKINAVLRFSL